jgi:hypothetical protein
MEEISKMALTRPVVSALQKGAFYIGPRGQG